MCEIDALEFYVTDSDEVFDTIKCPNQGVINFDGKWVCWEHLRTNYGFDAAAMV